MSRSTWIGLVLVWRYSYSPRILLFLLFSFSLVYGDSFDLFWELVQHTLILVWVSIVFLQGWLCCGSRSGIQCSFDPGWKFGPAINIPDLQHGRVGDETRKSLANSAIIVSHLFWIRNTRSLQLTSHNFYNLLLPLIEGQCHEIFASCLLFFTPSPVVGKSRPNA